MSLLEQNTIWKGRVDENAIKQDAGNNSGEYKVEAIWNSVLYARELESGHLTGFYYLVSWKRYSKEENTWELVLAVQYLKKVIGPFHKDYPDKPTATSSAIHNVPPTIKPIVKLTEPLKRKRG